MIDSFARAKRVIGPQGLIPYGRVKTIALGIHPPIALLSVVVPAKSYYCGN